jgi:hypothetical protein
MASRSKRTPAGPADTAGRPEGRPELIVVLDQGAEVTVKGGRVVPSDQASQELLAPIANAPPDTLDAARVLIRPLFTSNPERLAEATPPDAADRVVSPLGQYFVVDGVVGGEEQLLEQLRAVDVVAGAYLKPAAELPAAPARTAALNDMTPRAEEPPAVTPDFSGRQGYLNPPPGGVNARWAWTQPGGRGENVNVIDVEGAWRLTHEDLLPRRIGVSAGTPSELIGWRNHGTAVVGVIGSDENGFGTTGIAPKASLSTIPIFGTGMSSASAIKLAADALGPGDILLIELHRPGPLAGTVGQRGYICVEWWPDDYDAIVYAVSRGVIVVEAAGNGSQDLDDPAYDTPQTGFPPSWRNPFRRGLRDSGAIVVGAGAPPSGTHGASTWGPDRSRLDFSNFGSIIDVQGWGREVTTCGYGDLQGGSGSEDYWYTDQFSGTSSASPIVTGSLACVQGILRRAGVTQLTPQTARRFLRETGSPQQAGPDAAVTQRIGNRPDIRALVARAPTGKDGQKEQKEKEKEQEGDKSFVKLEKNEFKEMLEQGRPQPVREDVASGMEARLTALEDAIAELRHFISSEQRPDLTVLARDSTAAAVYPDTE